MRLQNMGFGLMLSLVLTACATGTHALAAEKTLAFGISAYRPEAVMLPQWRPLADYLERTLPGYRISLKILEPEALEQAAQRGELDLVLTNPAHYIAIRSNNLLSGAIATLVRREGDLALAVLGGVIFTAEDRDDIDGLEDLIDKRIALSGLYNLGGYAAPMTELKARGIGPEQIDLRVVGAPHDRTIAAVLSGAADAGFVRTGVIEQMQHEGRLTNRMPPFEHLTPIGWHDLWAQHRIALIAAPCARTDPARARSG